MRASRLLGLLVFVALAACEPSPGAPDAAREDASTPDVCVADRDCSDGVFCNGLERCAPGVAGASPSGCVGGPVPCVASQVCEEALTTCVSDCGVAPDADGDGRRAIACGGDDCDDADADRYPGNAEICDDEGHDEDCVPLTLAGAGEDRDGDGFPPTRCCVRTSAGELVCGGDCDDTTFGRSPGAVEVCNGVDDDCNGALDHPAEDDDGDMHADDACAGAGGSDCDDGDPNVYVGATELCNGRDDDCSIAGVRRRAGEPGEERAEDADGDGHAPLEAACSAEAPAGVEAFARDDCDDARADVHTGAIERCDGIDNDCDGVIDDTDGATEGGACIPVEVVAGAQHTCVRMHDGGVICWGGNASAQLGDDSAPTGAAVRVPGLVDPVQLSAGDVHSCALERDGRVVCWGARALIDVVSVGSTATGLGEVPRVSGATRIASGASHACAIVGTGSVSCWGRTEQRQLDGMTTDSASALAITVPGIDDAVQLDVGSYHGCAVRRGGGVYCWGPNYGSHLGVDSAPMGRADVPGITDAIAVAAGFVHTCVLHRDGGVSCWGDNSSSQLGVAGAGGAAARRVPGVSGAVAIVAGASHTCARREDGSVTCWGADADGQLGARSTAASRLPTSAVLGAPARALSTGLAHSCAIMDDAIRCWGSGADHRLGSGRTRGELVPRVPSAIAAPIAMATWLSYSCFVLPSHELRCTGYSSGGSPYLEPGSDTPIARWAPERFRSTRLGYRFACHLREDGSIRCDGSNNAGQLGRGAIGTPPPATTSVVGITDARAVESGNAHSCALVGDRVWCWGSNDRGQLGSATGGALATPGEVLGLSGVVQIALGGAHSCARTETGAVLCWGDSAHGQAGATAGTVTRPTLVALPEAAIDLSAHDGSSCAVLESGAALCWGDGYDGSEVAAVWSAEPQLVSGLPPVTQVAAGYRHACARLRTRRVMCWGANVYGQLGNGTTTSSARPVLVSGLSDARDVSIGSYHTCAVRTSGQAVCWGRSAPVMGTASAASTPEPVVMLGE